MALRQFANNAASTLSGSIGSGSTSITVFAGSGALFPALTGSQYFAATLIKNGNSSIFEIVKVTAHASDTFTIVRAQEGTTALAWNFGDAFALLPTAGDLQVFAQFDDLQAQATNYAIDTGAANAYVVALTPALTAHQVGLPIRWLASNANTGASTFSDGTGAVSMKLAGNVPIPAGAIKAGSVYTCVWNSSFFEVDAFAGSFSAGMFGTDVGSSNAYSVALGLTAHSTGVPVRFIAANSNSGASTLNDGFAAAAIVTPAGLPLSAGAIVAGTTYECFWNGTAFQLGEGSSTGVTPSAHKSLNTNRSSTTTLTQDPDLVCALPIGSFEISGLLIFNEASSGSGGIKLELTYSGAGAGIIGINGSVAGSPVTISGANSCNNIIGAFASVSITGIFDWIKFQGTVLTSVAGNFAVAWAQNSSSVNATQLSGGSYIKFTPIS